MKEKKKMAEGENVCRHCVTHRRRSSDYRKKKNDEDEDEEKRNKIIVVGFKGKRKFSWQILSSYFSNPI